MRRWPGPAPAELMLVLLPAAAVLTLPAYQCLVQVEPSEQAQARREAQRAARLEWRFRHGRSQLGRSAGPPRFVAPLGPGSGIDLEACRRGWMQ